MWNWETLYVRVLLFCSFARLVKVDPTYKHIKEFTGPVYYATVQVTFMKNIDQDVSKI